MTAETKPPAPISADLAATGFAPFLIPAISSLQEQRPLTLKNGDTFAVFDHSGDIHFGRGSSEGIFYRDTRHLSLFYLTIEGVRPILLSSTLRDDNATVTCDLTNPDLFDDPDRPPLEHDLLHIRRSRFLWDAHCFERLAIRNFDEQPRQIRIRIAFAADFADLFEVRGTRRKRRGVTHPPEVDARSVTLSYTGLDDRLRTTVLRFEPAPTILDRRRGCFRRRSDAAVDALLVSGDQLRFGAAEPLGPLRLLRCASRLPSRASHRVVAGSLDRHVQ